jgi:hypothetical protein
MKRFVARPTKIAAPERSNERATELLVEPTQVRWEFRAGLQQNA